MVRRDQLTKEQHIFIVQTYLAGNTYRDVRRIFRKRFPGRTPSISTIQRNVEKFQRLGSVDNQNAGHSGRLRTSRTPETIDRVREALEENPNLSSRRNGLDIPHTIFNEITRLDLNFHPYRMKIRH